MFKLLDQGTVLIELTLFWAHLMQPLQSAFGHLRSCCIKIASTTSFIIAGGIRLTNRRFYDESEQFQSDLENNGYFYGNQYDQHANGLRAANVAYELINGRFNWYVYRFTGPEPGLSSSEFFSGRLNRHTPEERTWARSIESKTELNIDTIMKLFREAIHLRP